MNGPFEARIQVLSRPPLLAVVRRAVEAWCDLAGADESTRCRVGLAVDEALTNIIRHGYAGGADGVIDIGMRCGGSTIEFVIEDRARQVQLDQIKGRALDDIRPGGLGVHLIREVMDVVVWSHRQGGGMRLELTKELSVAPTLVEAKDDR